MAFREYKFNLKRKGIDAMNKPIFTIADINNEVIVLKVNCESPLMAAQHPYVDMTYDYISLTRGKDHILTVVDKQGKSWSFHFGSDGYTWVDKRSELLKSKVLGFLEDNQILISYCGAPLYKATAFYNSNYNKWQLSLEGDRDNSTHYFSKTAHSVDELLAECKHLVKADTWEKGVAPTDIDIWTAQNPKFKILDHEKKILLKSKNGRKYII